MNHSTYAYTGLEEDTIARTMKITNHSTSTPPQGADEGRHSSPNQVDAVSAPHLRRCIKLGLLRMERKDLVLTEAGIEALGVFRV